MDTTGQEGLKLNVQCDSSSMWLQSLQDSQTEMVLGQLKVAFLRSGAINGQKSVKNDLQHSM
jgi:hypothetical protein